MKKSPKTVIQLFVYSIVLVLTIIWAVKRGGFYIPYEAPRPDIPVYSVEQNEDIPAYVLPEDGIYIEK